MLSSIFSWLCEAVGEVLEVFANWVLTALNMDITVFGEIFPVFNTTYEIFRALAVAVTVLIAAFKLLMFFRQDASEISEPPLSLLFRAFWAVALIYFGGWIVQWVVNFAKLPYDAMVGISAVGTPAGESVSGAVSFAALSAGVTVGFLFGGIGLEVVSIGVAAMLVISLILLVTIAWQLVRYALELFQRFVMVGILVYTAPLAFSTLASKDTSQIFRAWLNMFITQCLLMTFSAWLFKAIVSAFAPAEYGDYGYVFRWLCAMALCTVAGRLDSYLNQLGLNSVTTGRSVLDGYAANLQNMMFGRMARGGGGRSSGGDGDVLGRAAGWAWDQSHMGSARAAGAEAFRSGSGAGGAAKAAWSASRGESTGENPFGFKNPFKNYTETQRRAAASETAARNSEAYRQYRAEHGSSPSFHEKASDAARAVDDLDSKRPYKPGTVTSDGKGNVALDQAALDNGLALRQGDSLKRSADLREDPDVSLYGPDNAKAAWMSENWGNGDPETDRIIANTLDRDPGLAGYFASDREQSYDGANMDKAAGQLYGDLAAHAAGAENGGADISDARHDALNPRYDEYGNRINQGYRNTMTVTDRDTGERGELEIIDSVTWSGLPKQRQALFRETAGAGGEQEYARYTREGEKTGEIDYGDPIPPHTPKDRPTPVDVRDREPDDAGTSGRRHIGFDAGGYGGPEAGAESRPGGPADGGANGHPQSSPAGSPYAGGSTRDLDVPDGQAVGAPDRGDGRSPGTGGNYPEDLPGRPPAGGGAGDGSATGHPQGSPAGSPYVSGNTRDPEVPDSWTAGVPDRGDGKHQDAGSPGTGGGYPEDSPGRPPAGGSAGTGGAGPAGRAADRDGYAFGGDRAEAGQDRTNAPGLGESKDRRRSGSPPEDGPVMTARGGTPRTGTRDRGENLPGDGTGTSTPGEEGIGNGGEDRK